MSGTLWRLVYGGRVVYDQGPDYRTRKPTDTLKVDDIVIVLRMFDPLSSDNVKTRWTFVMTRLGIGWIWLYLDEDEGIET